MAGLKLNHIYKVYPNGAKAVNDFTMEIKDKEFIVFVGPSGCGKSTTLRMIAGLEEISAGELTMDGVFLNDTESKDRDVAMVFQNYALYPHMTVYENMAFGLKMRKVPKDVIDGKIKEAAEILGITEYLKRKPAAMSGGQRQRVALGRAIVREPKVFLLDEPLSNLDAKLRTAMRSEITKLHNKLKTTFIYVTHDQIEAMTMGTRIVVMKDGFIQQIDAPRNLYRFPRNKFVAGFIGTPQMNFYGGRLLLQGAKVRITFDDAQVNIEAPRRYFEKADVSFLDGEKPVILGIRAEHLSCDPKAYPYVAKCKVSHVEELGTESLVFGDFNLESGDAVTESPTKVIIKAPAGAKYAPDQIIDVSLRLGDLCVFDAQTEETLLPRIPGSLTAYGTVQDGKLNLFGAKTALPAAMDAPDGEYTVSMPTSAVSLGGKIRAEIGGTEDIDGERLVRVRAGGSVIFVRDSETDLAKVNGISVDLKRITLKSKDFTLEAVPDKNRVGGVFVRQKEITEAEANGKLKKKKLAAFYLEIGGYRFPCPAEKAARIVSGGGKRVFGKKLSFRFSPYDVKISDAGLCAEVSEILDYGGEKFAKCAAGDLTLFVAAGKDFSASRVNLWVDASAVEIWDDGSDVRLA